MEEVLGIVGFSLGASLGVGVTRSLGQGLRPFVRNAMKLGIRVWDATGSASAAVRAEVSRAGDETAAARPRARTRSRNAPRKIAIARS